MRIAARTTTLTVTLIALWILSTFLPANEWGRTATVAVRVLGLFGIGVTWSYALWASKEIDPLERGVLAFALSLALISLGVFVTAQLGIAASERSFTVMALAIDLLGLAVLWLRVSAPPARKGQLLRL